MLSKSVQLNQIYAGDVLPKARQSSRLPRVLSFLRKYACQPKQRFLKGIFFKVGLANGGGTATSRGRHHGVDVVGPPRYQATHYLE